MTRYCDDTTRSYGVLADSDLRLYNPHKDEPWAKRIINRWLITWHGRG